MTFSSSGFTAGGFDITDLGQGQVPRPPGADLPELGSIKIRFPDLGIEFDHFLGYEFHEDYLVPVDAGSFSMSGDELSDRDRSQVRPGVRVEVSINDQLQSSGILDDIRSRNDRHVGTVVTYEFRSWLSPALDSHVDPQTRFAPSMSLLDLVQAALGPFGVNVFSTDNAANRNSITGGIHGPRTSKKGKPLKSYILHQQKPYPNEGAFAFASRVSQRFGLWIRPGALVGEVIIGQPDFDQEPRYALHHKLDSSSVNNNVLESEVIRSRKDQPSAIFASGAGGGGEFAKATLKAGIINPFVSVNNDPIISKYNTIQWFTPSSVAISAAIDAGIQTDAAPRPLFLQDRDSRNMDELQAFLRRELSLRMRKVLTGHYVIEGHGLNGQALAVDSIISVDDDRNNLRQAMWIQGRRFSKQAGSTGTTTSIELILPGTLSF